MGAPLTEGVQRAARCAHISTTHVALALAPPGPKWAMVSLGMALEGVAMVLYMQCNVRPEARVLVCTACTLDVSLIHNRVTR